jgi:hypothetical protein
MSEPNSSPTCIKRSVWLSLGVGFLAQLGLKIIFPTVVLVVVRFFSLETENESLWLENPDNSSHPVWYALQGSVFLASMLAGWLAAILSPAKSRAALVGLVMLSLLSTVFEQLPRPLSIAVMLIWAAGPCIGLAFGWLVAQWRACDDT